MTDCTCSIRQLMQVGCDCVASWALPRNKQPDTRTITVTLHQFDNGYYGLKYDGKLLGDSRPMDKTEAHEKALEMHGNRDGMWVGSDWVPTIYHYRMPVVPGQARAMSKNDNS